MKEQFDFDNLIFQLTKKSTDIYIDFSKIDLINFFGKDIQYISKDQVITQQVKYVQYGQKVLDLFLSARNNSQILYKDILNKLSDRWLYKQDFKKAIALEDIPIIYYVYNFNSLQQTNKMLTIVLKSQYLKNKKILLNSYYKQFETSAGYFKVLRDKYTKFPAAFLMCIDSNFVNKRMIKHQLTHYFQAGLFILGKLKKIDTSNLKDIPSLDLKKRRIIIFILATIV